MSNQDVEERLSLVYSYKEHIQAVQADRGLEELLQTENIFQSGSAPGILFLQTDGMDQAKWAVPRAGSDRSAKQTANIVRKPFES